MRYPGIIPHCRSIGRKIAKDVKKEGGREGRKRVYKKGRRGDGYIILISF